MGDGPGPGLGLGVAGPSVSYHSGVPTQSGGLGGLGGGLADPQQPLSLVSISEPLLDLRQYGGPGGECGGPGPPAGPQDPVTDLAPQPHSPKYICL